MLAIYSVYTTPVLHHASPSLRRSFSGQGRNRTTDTTIFSRVLYQLSYLARKKNARPFGDGRLGEGCALRAC